MAPQKTVNSIVNKRANIVNKVYYGILLIEFVEDNLVNSREFNYLFTDRQKAKEYITRDVICFGQEFEPVMSISENEDEYVYSLELTTPDSEGKFVPIRKYITIRKEVYE